MKITVVGRSNFSVGIGKTCESFLELLTPDHDVKIYVIHGSLNSKKLVLNSGKSIKVVGKAELENSDVIIFSDVLWNGQNDKNFEIVPPESSAYRIAYIAWDSTKLPDEFVKILNTRFDKVLFSNEYLEKVALDSGVKISIGTLSLALRYFESEYIKKQQNTKRENPIKLGSVSAYHPRKNHNLTIEAFQKVGKKSGAELKIHSNLFFNKTYEDLCKLITPAYLKKITLSHQEKNEEEIYEFLSSLDIFINISSGEGFSIGVREALYLGKPLIVSKIPAHSDLLHLPGVFGVEAFENIKAIYPEIDFIHAGNQQKPCKNSLIEQMGKALYYVKKNNNKKDEIIRQNYAFRNSYLRQKDNYLNCVKTNMIQRQRKEESTKQSINVISRDKKIKNKIVQAHDGGFFSVFNAYISNLTWYSMNNDGALILPDWDISRLLNRLHAKCPKSFCYGKREDQNIWCNFFQPVYSLSKEKLNSEAFLYENSEVVIDIHNTRYEPFLTYKNAEALYKAQWFPYFRKQYHNTFKKNVFIRPHIQQKINTMKSNFFGRYMIGLHIAHPSHAMEQPSEKLPSLEDYINKIYSVLKRYKLNSKSDYGIFIATSRQAVIKEIEAEFRGNTFYYTETSRTSNIDENKYRLGGVEARLKEGFNIQHILSADEKKWSSANGDDVLQDVYCLAECDVLIHVVSNISTAVSYINPKVNMIYLKKGK